MPKQPWKTISNIGNAGATLQSDYQRCKSGSYAAKRLAVLEVLELRRKTTSCVGTPAATLQDDLQRLEGIYHNRED
jgi:hypothetical protein